MDRVVITVNVDGHGQHNLDVNAALPLRGLIDEIADHLSLGPGPFNLALQGRPTPLDANRTLEQLAIPDGAVLLFREANATAMERLQALIDSGERLPIKASSALTLVTERESAPFEISWQPAIVGRADHRNPEGNRLLAVDLTGFKNAEYVSRHHACIMEENAEYFLVAIRDRNPTFLNEQELEVGQRVALQPGDRVRVGRTTLIVNQRERMSHT